MMIQCHCPLTNSCFVHEQCTEHKTFSRWISVLRVLDFCPSLRCHEGRQRTGERQLAILYPMWSIALVLPIVIPTVIVIFHCLILSYLLAGKLELININCHKNPPLSSSCATCRQCGWRRDSQSEITFFCTLIGLFCDNVIGKSWACTEYRCGAGESFERVCGTVPTHRTRVCKRTTALYLCTISFKCWENLQDLPLLDQRLHLLTQRWGTNITPYTSVLN